MSSLLYNIKQGFIQIFRNRGMSLASIFSIVAMLLILGLFFVITVNVNLFTEVVKQDYDQVEVFLLEETTNAEAQELMAKIKARDGVTDVVYRTKDDALEIMKQRWGESGYLLDSLGENPLPASILISVESLDNAGAVAAYAGTLEGVDDIQYYQETVEKLTRITDFLQIGAMVIMVFLVVVSVVVVSNTVKLTLSTGSVTIVTQPVSAAVAKGENAVVSVEATGEGLTYQWYYKNPGNVKFYLSGSAFVSEDGATYTIPMAAWRDGQEVYCVVTDENGESVQSNTVTLSMKKAAIEIVEQPVDVVAENGKLVVVNVEAKGEGLTYTWYYKNPGNVKFYESSADFVNGNQYVIQVAPWRDGQQVYCVITDANGDTVQTNTVTLSIAK